MINPKSSSHREYQRQCNLLLREKWSRAARLTRCDLHSVSSEGGGSESIRSPAIDAKRLMHGWSANSQQRCGDAVLTPQGSHFEILTAGDR
jgi:hypothetical protein